MELTDYLFQTILGVLNKCFAIESQKKKKNSDSSLPDVVSIYIVYLKCVWLLMCFNVQSLFLRGVISLGDLSMPSW